VRRHPPKRDSSEKEIIAVLRAAGCTVYQVGGKDVPDLVIGMRGRNVVAEVKTGNAKLRPGQAAWAEAWRGDKPVVLRSVDDALALVRQ
jgi:hypothetical protein